MKTAIIALSAAALIAATPAVGGQQHKVFKKHHHQVVYGYAPWRHAHATYPGAFSFAPSGPKDYTYENSRNGGGGGGGGGGM